MRNDFYMNIMDWGKNNVLAVALGLDLYLWNSDTANVRNLFHVNENDHPTSLAWSQDAKYLAVGYQGSKIQLWDAEASKLVKLLCCLTSLLITFPHFSEWSWNHCSSICDTQVRSLKGHHRRVATIAWNGNTLTSGSRDRSIINHDGILLLLLNLKLFYSDSKSLVQWNDHFFSFYFFPNDDSQSKKQCDLPFTCTLSRSLWLEMVGNRQFIGKRWQWKPLVHLGILKDELIEILVSFQRPLCCSEGACLVSLSV